VGGGLLPAADIALLRDGELGALALGQRDPGLRALTNDENVGDTRSERAVKRVTDVDDIEATVVVLAVGDDTRTTHVTTASDDDDVARVELDVVDDLVLLEIVLDGVVCADGRVRVADGTAVVGDDVRHTTGADCDAADLEELEGSLLGGDAVNDEAALDVVQDAEVLASALKRDDVLETSRVGVVGLDLAVNLDEALGKNLGDLTASDGVLEAVPEQDREGEGFPELEVRLEQVRL